jgi:hypothetical protein
VIVVVGSPVGRLVDGRTTAGGLAGDAARAAAGGGRAVQLVGRIGDDAAADAVLLDLAAAGVGHVAVLRDPARATPVETGFPPERDAGPSGALDDSDIDVEVEVEASTSTSAQDDARPIELEAADVELGLRYLTDFAVVVLVPPTTPEVIGVVTDAVRWAAATLVLVLQPGEAAPADHPPDAIVIEAPETDPDGAFAILVGRLAAALDGGVPAADAFREVVEGAGWTAAAEP